MAHKIVTVPHPALSTKSAEIKQITTKTMKMAASMVKLMREARGIGLAANQIGKPIRLAIIELYSKSEVTEEDLTPIDIKSLMPMVMVNPILEKKGEVIESLEGCLSIPESKKNNIKVLRNKEVKLTYTTLGGQTRTLRTYGPLAICIQHEVDHLDGITLLAKQNDG